MVMDCWGFFRSILVGVLVVMVVVGVMWVYVQGVLKVFFQGILVKFGFCDVFLVVDVQNDFIFGGVFVVKEGDVIVLFVNQFGVGFEYVILIQDWYILGYVFVG